MKAFDPKGREVTFTGSGSYFRVQKPATGFDQVIRGKKDKAIAIFEEQKNSSQN
jgi:hypothetical protein